MSGRPGPRWPGTKVVASWGTPHPERYHSSKFPQVQASGTPEGQRSPIRAQCPSGLACLTHVTDSHTHCHADPNHVDNPSRSFLETSGPCGHPVDVPISLPSHPFLFASLQETVTDQLLEDEKTQDGGSPSERGSEGRESSPWAQSWHQPTQHAVHCPIPTIPLAHPLSPHAHPPACPPVAKPSLRTRPESRRHRGTGQDCPPPGPRILT